MLLEGVPVNAKTAGREDLVVIAVKSRGDEMADFSALEQKNLEGVRNDMKTGLRLEARPRLAVRRSSPQGVLWRRFPARPHGGRRRGVFCSSDARASDPQPPTDLEVGRAARLWYHGH